MHVHLLPHHSCELSIWPGKFLKPWETLHRLDRLVVCWSSQEAHLEVYEHLADSSFSMSLGLRPCWRLVGTQI